MNFAKNDVQRKPNMSVAIRASQVAKNGTGVGTESLLSLGPWPRAEVDRRKTVIKLMVIDFDDHNRGCVGLFEMRSMIQKLIPSFQKSSFTDRCSLFGCHSPSAVFPLLTRA